MKCVVLSSLIYVTLISSVFAQVYLIKYTPSSDGFTLSLSFDNEPYLFEGEDEKTINFFNNIDENNPGTPNLPSRTVYIAIPPTSKIKLSFTNEKFNLINNVVPKSNPEIKLAADSTLVYRDTKINPSYVKSDNYPAEKYHIEGYTWIRDYYCAVVRIHTYR